MQRPEYAYIHPDFFSGDSKAFFARLVTMGWVARMRMRANGDPLKEGYSTSFRVIGKVLPLMHQLTERPLLELVEEFFHSTHLYTEASRCMAPAFIRESAQDFRRLLFDFDEAMNADFHQLLEWFENRSVLFSAEGESLQSRFLKENGWKFSIWWDRCSLEYRSHQPHPSGFTKVLCHQVAGNWSPLGYVPSVPARTRTESGKAKEDLTLRTPRGNPPQAFVCRNAIELSAAMRAYRPWHKEAEIPLSRHMRHLERRLGLDANSRYEYFREHLEEFVFWHECGHLHFEDLERELCFNEIGETFFDRYYRGKYSELLADAFAFEHWLKGAGELLRKTAFALLLYDCSLEELVLSDVIALRSLKEECPSLFVYDFVFEAICQLRKAGRELVRRARSENLRPEDLGWYSWVESQEKELLGDFLEWQESSLRRARQELVAWMF